LYASLATLWLIQRPLLAGCSCTGVSAFPQSVATPQIPFPKADLVSEESTLNGLSPLAKQTLFRTR
jgi:hypothetical protein